MKVALIGRIVQGASQVVQAVILLAVVGGIALVVYWLTQRGPEILDQVDPVSRVTPQRPVLQRDKVLVADPVDSTVIRMSAVEVEDAPSYIGTITLQDGDQLAAVGIRRLDLPWFYEFGKRAPRGLNLEVNVLPYQRGGWRDSLRVFYTVQPRPLFGLELAPYAGLGFTGRVQVIAGVSIVRVWGVHAGGFLGYQPGDPLSYGVLLAVRPLPRFSIGAGLDARNRAGMIALIANY